MLFVVGNDSEEDFLVDLSTGVGFFIDEVNIGNGRKAKGLVRFGKAQKLELIADAETLFRFRELVRKTKEKE